MKKIFVLAILAIISQIGLSANTRKQITFVDENGKARTDLTSVTVLDQGTETLSTIYTSTTNTAAITNPMTTTSTNTGINAAAGWVVFWSSSNNFDLLATIGGKVFKFSNVATTDKRFTIMRVQSPGMMVSDTPSVEIWVSPSGGDASGNGSFGNPYLTINKALSVATTTRNTVIVMPGTYEESIEWPSVTGITLKSAVGGATVYWPDGETLVQVVDISPVFEGIHFTATIEDMVIRTGDELTGISINNIGHAHEDEDPNSLTVNLVNVTVLDLDTYADKSVWVQHADPNAKIVLNVLGEGQEWEGAVSFVCGRTDDFLSIKNQVLVGGLTTTGNYAGEVFLRGVGVKTGALSIDNDHKLTNIGCWYLTADDPAVYTTLTDAFATYE